MAHGLTLKANLSKEAIISTIADWLKKQDLRIVSQDFNRPWGGFFVIDEAQVDQFIDAFFSGERGRISDGKLSPKILLLAPGQRLSWQYHHRRQELWKIITGPVGIYLSHTNTQPDKPQVVSVDEIIHVGRGERHRLEGMDNWGVVAEIWSHTDPSSPSDENDIVRLADDFGRSNPNP